MKIGEVSRRTGIPASTLRYYESVGLFPKPARERGQRAYDPSILDHLALVQVSKAAGFTVSEIRQLLRGFERTTPASKRWQVLAETKVAEVDERIEQLRSMKRVLSAVLRCECPTLRDCSRVIKRERDRSLSE